MIAGYRFSPPQTPGGSAVHTVESGEFVAQFAVMGNDIIITVVRNQGTERAQVCGFLRGRTEPARWAEQALTLVEPVKLTPSKTDSVLYGEPFLVVVPGHGKQPPLVTFTDRRWMDEQGRIIGIRIAADMVAHLGRPVDLNTLIPVG